LPTQNVCHLPLHNKTHKQGTPFENQISTAIADVREASQQQQYDIENATAATNRNIACPRLFLRMAELRAYDAQLPQRFRLDPLRHMRALETAAQDVAEQNEPGYDKTCKSMYRYSSSLAHPAHLDTILPPLTGVNASLVVYIYSGKNQSGHFWTNWGQTS
jgi:hypothetical protein